MNLLQVYFTVHYPDYQNLEPTTGLLHCSLPQLTKTLNLLQVYFTVHYHSLPKPWTYYRFTSLFTTTAYQNLEPTTGLLHCSLPQLTKTLNLLQVYFTVHYHSLSKPWTYYRFTSLVTMPYSVNTGGGGGGEGRERYDKHKDIEKQIGNLITQTCDLYLNGTHLPVHTDQCTDILNKISHNVKITNWLKLVPSLYNTSEVLWFSWHGNPSAWQTRFFVHMTLHIDDAIKSLCLFIYTPFFSKRTQNQVTGIPVQLMVTTWSRYWTHHDHYQYKTINIFFQ